MIYKVSDRFVKQLVKDHFRSLVGRLCKLNEVIDERKDLNDGQKLSILKNLQKEKVYESGRDLENKIKVYSQGLEFKKYKAHTPTDAKTAS